MRAFIDLFTLIFRALLGPKLTPTEDTSSAHPVEPPPEVSPLPDELEISDPVPPIPGITAPEQGPEKYGKAGPLIEAMRRKGYEVFEKDDRNFNLNIVAVRNPRAKLDEFACRLCLFWKFQGKWHFREWEITTFPGRRYLIDRLLNVRGAAILVPGQYLGVYKLDLHGGRYRAMCQRNGPVSVYRDGNRDRVFDLNPSKIHKGWFGINIHAPRPVRGFVAKAVGAFSAGCQVFRRADDFYDFMALAEESADIYGNQFSFTLLTDDDLEVAASSSAPPASHATAVPDLTTAEKSPSRDWNPDFDTAGVRNKNLLNVKGSDWLYSLGRDSRGHNKFPTFEKGLRAGIITLRSYWTRHKKRSIMSILSRWAPVTDTIGSLPGAPPNSPREYGAFVSKRVGVHAFATLNLFNEEGEVVDPDQLYRLVSAMAAYENDAALKLPREIFDGALALV